MTDPTPTRTTTLHYVDVPLGAQLVLRCTVSFDEGGRPAALILACGLLTDRDDSDSFFRPSWYDGPLTMPAYALPDLRRALKLLEAKR